MQSSLESTANVATCHQGRHTNRPKISKSTLQESMFYTRGCTSGLNLWCVAHLVDEVVVSDFGLLRVQEGARHKGRKPRLAVLDVLLPEGHLERLIALVT